MECLQHIVQDGLQRFQKQVSNIRKCKAFFRLLVAFIMLKLIVCLLCQMSTMIISHLHHIMSFLRQHQPDEQRHSKDLNKLVQQMTR